MQVLRIIHGGWWLLNISKSGTSKGYRLSRTAPVEEVGVNMQQGAIFRSNVFSYDSLRGFSVYGRYPVPVAGRMYSIRTKVHRQIGSLRGH